MSSLDPEFGLSLDEALTAVADNQPLVNSVTNNVTVNDVANITLHWGGLPVMSDDEREVADMVAIADGCLLNMGTVSETGEATMLAAGAAAGDHDVPLVVDPVGVGATPTRSRVAERLVTELDVDVLNGNYGEISALVGENAEVRGVESVGEYAEIAATAVECARQTGAVVVASGETDIVATEDAAYEVHAGHSMMGEVVGTGCMLGVTLAVFAAAIDDPLDAALAGTAAYGLAGELAADGVFGDYHGPASYRVSFLDAAAGLAGEELSDLSDRVERIEVR
ncbi:hydroxyethylthiazole kinase [Haloferax mediterranei ATCC 33500]|uniref:Hydroxyethylthiazole kinase n=1 Tax=Haloferax mediterranei (strain ATCC 33500 / DSM 1411 / JCM 8866 / NBRC 14739 / NCIMB 2177 / R-4) TaxID=523841 RepID=I3R802_HALMT|nr:hydroxyethylthiazole kinase [Haloferax mediterranei]AFK20362.1 hydroxyethylthiazole kinase [Haloferax mediterranei ATCC 33500]AHZ23728.1 hydroxyethylthiazole kinase [Haloferax mediterranei ATCC 33500]ELZ99217.1 hydroxyethylthiazole kinase [Haloferax mediterranei ATCC 33500]MDX5986883.1 hydroxyethylthiazole kinase [Haloferax mediterranei ATCC 33500]QCQ76206.1 hydroxyethylthiazole kinase [Haloferax mediterranei ATCC 33500]